MNSRQKDASNQLRALLAGSGCAIVIVGPPDVGKSTVVQQTVPADRVMCCDIPADLAKWGNKIIVHYDLVGLGKVRCRNLSKLATEFGFHVVGVTNVSPPAGWHVIDMSRVDTNSKPV